MVSRKRNWQLMGPLLLKRLVSSLFTVFICSQASATEYQPWLSNLFEFEWRNSLLYQGYRSIASGSEIQREHADDLFMDASIANTIPDIGLEIELRAASTRKQRGDIDQVKVTGRYIWLNDVEGDPLSVASGVSLIQAFRHSVKDISSFHHGKGECELFLSVGKETARKDYWDSRWWAVGAIGIADQGSPWLRLNMVYEKRWFVLHELRGFVNTLWGLGGHRLHRFRFDGYGPVQHQSVDLGLRYTYELEFFGSASLEYTYRVYGRNFPVHASCVLARLFYTFGL